MSIAWDILEPYLVQLGLYTTPDPSNYPISVCSLIPAYGRFCLPPHPPHLALINNPSVTHTYRRVFLKPYSEFDSLAEAYASTEILGSAETDLSSHSLLNPTTNRWICYSTWEMTQPNSGWEGDGKGVGRDLVLVHGK